MLATGLIPFLARLSVWVIAKLPFASLPLLINSVVWILVRPIATWPLLRIEDLSYFAILTSSETMLGLLLQAKVRRELRPVLLVAALLIAIGSAILLGQWHSETAHPPANGLFATVAQRFLIVGESCALAALACALIYVSFDQSEPDGVPRLDSWIGGRLLFALLPCLVNGFFALLASNAYQVWRVNDLSFFAIALSGPAILDLIHSRASVTARALWSVPLLGIVILSSVILGHWYFAFALPLEPAANVLIASTLLKASQACALLAFGVSSIVEMYIWRQAYQGANGSPVRTTTVGGDD
jgi:hypothetical protein